MTAAFNDAFSDYDIPANYTVEYLTNLVTRRGYRPDLAVGAVDGDRLVGFVFNCLDSDDAYNSGTGVVISHRRQGIARQLMQRSIETLPAKRYILECIETNHRAAALYRDLGFVVTRLFQCWTYDFRSAAAEDGGPPLRNETWWDMQPSWQNSTASLLRTREHLFLLGDERCYAIVVPSTGDVPQLAVRRDSRRQGLGSALLAAAACQTQKPLRILNIDDRNPELAEFLERCGARRTIRQMEMTRYR
jgi:ribosomal protein S18 acetylase RimI-like enzyme